MCLLSTCKIWPNILPDLVKCTFVQYICNTIQYMYKTKYALLHHPRTYTNEYIGIGSDVHVIMKVALKGQLSSNSDSSVGRTSRYKSQIWGTIPIVGQQFSFYLFFASHALLAGRLSPYKWNQAWHSSEVIRA